MKLRSILFWLISLPLSISALSAQPKYQVINTVVYQFRINYWFNMHHFLWNEAFLAEHFDSTMVLREIPEKLSTDFQSAVSFYRQHMIDRDLRSDDYMQAFKMWISEKEVIDDGQVPTEFIDHINVLKTFDELYNEIFWESHYASCRAAIDSNLQLIEEIEEPYWDRITDLTRAFILEDIIQVELVYVGKISTRNSRNRPYTSIFPTRVVMNTLDHQKVDGQWVELLFHESAHALILSESGFVGGTIQDVCQKLGIKSPRQLWHAYLFFFTGEVTKELLSGQGIEYPKTYMEYFRVFYPYHDALKQHLPSYIERELSLSEATREIVLKLK